MNVSTEDTEVLAIAFDTPDGPLRARVGVPTGPVSLTDFVPPLQQFTDGVVGLAIRREKRLGYEISCQKGHAVCCKQLVPISGPEAFYLRALISTLPQRRKHCRQGRKPPPDPGRGGLRRGQESRGLRRRGVPLHRRRDPRRGHVRHGKGGRGQGAGQRGVPFLRLRRHRGPGPPSPGPTRPNHQGRLRRRQRLLPEKVPNQADPEGLTALLSPLLPSLFRVERPLEDPELVEGPRPRSPIQHAQRDLNPQPPHP